MTEATAQQYPIHRSLTHRRTITEADIVNFVNLTALHYPYFIDMEFVKENMSSMHHNRFAPSPMIVSFSMGLVAPVLMDAVAKALEDHDVGPFAGMTSFDAEFKSELIPGDTLCVELETKITAISSRGYTGIDMRYLAKNQRDEVVAEFTEHALFHPPSRNHASKVV